MEYITSRKNAKVLNMKKLAASSQYRQEQGQFYCDGGKLLQEAIQNGAEITAVFFCGQEPENIPEGTAVYQVTRDIIEAVSPMKTPQDIIFSCRIKDTDVGGITGGHHIVMDGIQDPGNVGTIIRTANAFGMDSVIMVGTCADVYNPKTIRATMGALFRQKIVYTDYDGLKKLKERGMNIYAAALHNDSCDVREINYENSAVVIGSEGKGVSRDVLDLCTGTVVIPMMPECESLNASVAAAVIMWLSSGNNI